MSSKPTVTLEFAGDDKKLSAAMDRVGTSAREMETKVGKSTSDMANRVDKDSGFMSRTMSSAAGNMIASLGQFAVRAGTDFLKGMISEAREAEKVTASTAQGIKTMGAESWTSAKAIGDLSAAISNKTGVDDELIQSSANLLLTFGNIKNAAGQNNDVFNRALGLTQDLAAKGFGSADAAAKMLGKALNDPIAGITALGRAGVTFTDAQKSQIQAMVDSGDLLGAQKIILGEVEKQVGGTAEATATAGEKMATTWANFQEQLGTAVMPLLDNFLSLLSGVLDWASRNPEIVAAIAAIAGGIWLLNAALNANPIVLVITLVAALVIALIALWNNSAAFRDFFIGMWNGIQSAVGNVVNWIQNAWEGLMRWFADLPGRIGGFFSSLGNIIKEAFKGAINWIIDRLNWFVDRINDVIYGANWVNPFDDIPYVPHIGRLHTGGVVPGMIGEERLSILQAGEKVIPRGQAGNQTTGGTITFAGDTDSAFATAFMGLVRTGQIQVTA